MLIALNMVAVINKESVKGEGKTSRAKNKS
jgi:hypothetical protein